MKPTYLYIKQHNKTGLKYFGKTTQDPEKYLGSGIRWRNHLRVHGNDITTTWTLYTNKEELMAAALLFSETNKISESSEWANLKPENGLDGGDHGKLTDDGRRRKSEAMKNRKLSDETRKKISESNKGKTRTLEQNAANSERQKGKPGLLGPQNGQYGKTPWNKGLSIPSPNKGKKYKSSGPNPNKSHPAWNKGMTMPNPNKGKKYGPSGPSGPMTKLTCPHCNKEGGASMMKRYHFDLCKLIQQ